MASGKGGTTKEAVREVADRVLLDVVEQENGVPGVVAMATVRATSMRAPPASVSLARTRR